MHTYTLKVEQLKLTQDFINSCIYSSNKFLDCIIMMPDYIKQESQLL